MASEKKSVKKIATVPTYHNAAKLGQIASVVLMPGDPERAEWIANNFLDSPEIVSDIRGIKAFTGKYGGKKVSVMASGMGGPSAGLYSYELFNFYNVQKIIRTGTTGALQKDIKAGDLVLAMSASTDSNYASQYNLSGTISPAADFETLRAAYDFAEKNKFGVHAGMVFTSDLFSSYNAAGDKIWKQWAAMGALAQDMETYALYCNAAAAHKKALSILTVTVNKVTGKTVPYAFKSMEKMVLTALSLI